MRRNLEPTSSFYFTIFLQYPSCFLHEYYILKFKHLTLISEAFQINALEDQGGKYNEGQAYIRQHF